MGWLGIARGKFFDWKKRYGKANEHNALVPRDFWIDDRKRQAIVDFYDSNPLEGYRRLTFKMLDQNIAAVSPATTYRVLKSAGRLELWNRSPSKKGMGFVQPLKAHDHLHVGITYINVAGTFYYICSLLDGYSRMIVHWDIRPAMTELDVECIVQRAREKYRDARPRTISDNGPQFSREGLQGVHPRDRHDHFRDLSKLSAVERQRLSAGTRRSRATPSASKGSRTSTKHGA